jgi:16S rRNA (guanine(1405)-N(7))-methyltransferase
MDIKVYNKALKKDVADNLIKLIKSRTGLENVDDSLCAENIIEYLKKDRKALAKLSSAEDFKSVSRSRDVDDIVKYARSKLRPAYGLFLNTDTSKIKDLLKKGEDKIKDILFMHVSSGERMQFYEKFYQRIFEVTGKPESIIDIACGLNPMSFEMMGLPRKTKYIALELNQNDADNINKFFSIWKIDGKAFKHDITKEPIKYSADIAFAFKIFDIIDNTVVERIVNELDVKWIAASFSTKTVSRSKMRFKRRAGFQKMLRRIGLKYQTIEFENEIVYIIRKE